MFDRHLSCLVYWRLQRMRDDVHIRSDGRLIYNHQDGCVDTSKVQTIVHGSTVEAKLKVKLIVIK